MTAPAPRPPRSRLSPEQRREQLLDLGVRLLATRSVDELSIDLLAVEAGISRGLLYHYFGNKADFHEAVVRRAADALIEQTAPPETGDPVERLAVSMTAYVDFVVANHEGYLSLVRGAAGGNPTLREIYDEALHALTHRLFTEGTRQGLLADSPRHRLVVRGWAALVEQLVLGWYDDPGGVSREELLDLVTNALLALVGTLPD